jgi:pantoate--beta-alanine ligase
MQVARTIGEVRRFVAAGRRRAASVGLVPTMGALHAAHLNLVRACQRDENFTVVSIFVNPTQFGPNEDLARYPRDEAGDLEKCGQAGVDVVFLPSAAEMYPQPSETEIAVSALTRTLCGPHRPGHFEGVATVVAKLFNIVQPDRAYFGEKDFQQFRVLQRMAADLNFPVEVIGCPLVREPDGLAMSSRNAYLSTDERRQALGLIAALQHGRELITGGEQSPVVVEDAMLTVLRGNRIAEVDYASVVEPERLQPVERIAGRVLLAIAAQVGTTRLIDNLLVDPSGASG